MQAFRSFGVSPGDSVRHAPAATFGRHSPRRYGRMPPAPSPAAAADRHGDATPAPCWVDQDFEEFVFE